MFADDISDTEEDKKLVNLEKSVNELLSYFKSINTTLSKVKRHENYELSVAEDLKNLEQRFNKFVDQRQNEKHIENINMTLNTQSGVLTQQQDDLSALQKQLEELKLRKYKEEFVRLYENFEQKVKILYSNDDDPLYYLIDVISCIKELKVNIKDHEMFLFDLCKKKEKNMETMTKKLNEIEQKRIKSSEEIKIVDTFKLAIKSEKEQLSKMKQMGVVKEKIANFEKLFCSLKNELT